MSARQSCLKHTTSSFNRDTRDVRHNSVVSPRDRRCSQTSWAWRNLRKETNKRGSDMIKYPRTRKCCGRDLDHNHNPLSAVGRLLFARHEPRDKNLNRVFSLGLTPQHILIAMDAKNQCRFTPRDELGERVVVVPNSGRPHENVNAQHFDAMNALVIIPTHICREPPWPSNDQRCLVRNHYERPPET